jgi:hypothetical protein
MHKPKWTKPFGEKLAIRFAVLHVMIHNGSLPIYQKLGKHASLCIALVGQASIKELAYFIILLAALLCPNQ